MMNVPPAEAMRLSLYRYEAMLFHWNDSHDTRSEVEAPDAETAMLILDKINATPELTH